MKLRTCTTLALLAALATAAYADAQLSVKSQGDEAGQKAQKDSGPDSWQFWNKQNEAGQAINRRGGGGNAGPDSWQFWGPNRQLLVEKKGDEAGQKAQKDSGPDSWQFWNKQNEAGQKAQKDSGPDSWQFWNKQNEAGQAINRRGGGGNAGPDSWQFWGPNRQLLNRGNSGPDSWQFWNKQNEAGQKTVVKPQDPGDNKVKEAAPKQTAMKPQPQQTAMAAKKPEAAPKQTAMKPQSQQTAMAAKKPEAAPKQTAMKPQPQQTAMAAKKPEAAPKQTAMKPQPQQTAMAAKKPEAAQKQQAQQQQAQQQQAPVKGQNERGMNRGWGWGANADFANIPGGGQAYPLMNVRNIYTAAGWGGAPVTCAQAEYAHACSTRRKLLLHRKMLH